MPPLEGLRQNDLNLFAAWVSQGTGLDANLVRAWVLAETGNVLRRTNNPLNIMGPGGRPRSFESVREAADATVALLKRRYPGVMRAARSGDAEAQLKALAASPWDACQYRGTLSGGRCASAPPGTLLRATLKRVGGAAGAPSGPVEGVQSELGPDFGADPAGALFGWVGDLTGWIQEKAVLALAYVVLTLAAAALFVLGVMRTAGTSPSELATAAASRRSPFPEGF